MARMTYDELINLKLERATIKNTMNEIKLEYKVAEKASDDAYSRMTYVRDQQKKARRERYVKRGEYLAAKGEEKKILAEELEIAEQVYQDAIERYKTADKEFRELFEQKNVKWQEFQYFQSQYVELDKRVREYYKTCKYKKPKKTVSPQKTEASE